MYSFEYIAQPTTTTHQPKIPTTMNKLCSLLLVLLSTFVVSKAQNGLGEILPSPDTTKPYILIDTSFIVGSYLQQQTDLYTHYSYTGTEKIKAIQTRIFFDTAAFSNATVTAGPSLTGESVYFKAIRNTNYVTITCSYTGNDANWTFPQGAFAKFRLSHSGRFYDVDPDSMRVAGSQSYPNKATKSNGLDMDLGMKNYGGYFVRPPFTMPVYVFNQDNTPLGGAKVAFFIRKKAATQWDSLETYITDSLTGKALLKTNVDTSISYVKIRMNGDTAKAGDAVNITDAYKINDVVLEIDSLRGFQYYAADVNKNYFYTISDAFLIFNKIAQGAQRWNDIMPGKKDVMFFRKNQKDTIASNLSNDFSQTIVPTHDLVDTLNGEDSVSYWTVLLGDANSTGLTNIGMVMGRNTDDPSSSEYVRDMRVSYRNAKETVSFDIPKMTISTENEVVVPVTIVTNGVDVGSMQFGMVYDTTILEFSNIETANAVKNWTSYILVRGNFVEWGGYEMSEKQDVIRTNSEVFNLTFKVKRTGWTESPIKVVTKAVGNSKAEDVNINEANSEGKIAYLKVPIEFDFSNIFVAYPVPFNNVLTIETAPLLGGSFKVDVIDQLGASIHSQTQEVYTGGTQRMYIDLSGLSKGVYFVRYTNETKTEIKKIVKN